MASNPSKMTDKSGLRTPSPTKSRLPGIGGRSLPQRTPSVKGLANITLQPSSRNLLTRGPELVSKEIVSASKAPRTQGQSEGHPPGRQLLPKSNVSAGRVQKPNQPLGKAGASSSPSKSSAESVPQKLGYSRESLDSRLELLHLHAIHNSATKSQSEWQEDASNKYKQRFEALQNRNEQLNRTEIEALAQKNATALLAWSGHGNCLEKQIQTLSYVVSEIESLTAADGKYTQAIQAFDHWITPAMSLMDQSIQRTGSKIHRGIDGLGDGWLAEVEILQTKLVNFADMMLSLPELGPGDSDIQGTVSVVSEMLKNMLEELDMVLTAESAILQEEKASMNGSISAITDKFSKDLSLR